jgi:hypothetical protein
MVHYQYFVSPKTPLTNERLNQIPGVHLYDEINNLYLLPSVKILKTLFKIKQEIQGTGGRNSDQPIDFSVHRRFGDAGVITEMTRPQIQNCLRGELALKPAYLQRAKY